MSSVVAKFGDSLAAHFHGGKDACERGWQRCIGIKKNINGQADNSFALTLTGSTSIRSKFNGSDSWIYQGHY
jgi:hypothetical protein